MRRPVLLLVALLLVLRGWMGDAMATQMPVSPVRAALPAVAQPCSAAATAAADAPGPAHGHHGHGAADAAKPAHGLAGLPDEGPRPAAAPPADCGAGHAGHGGCGDCQVCHSAVPAFDARAATPATRAQAAPACGRADFASADRAPALRPPIASPHRP